ncbi:hypothetical protein [Sediminispirochaeta smaragdinae]|uniref:Uncharacterized protein n=1 Tax=Sediminispirochaeta smaragdinae (strain DSM 11293 / JCM 15392 / SEBR 4228) TaxID=573413 RepID=E1R4Z7_SEDSS|nr:hypothetical protein [Sediminispirochaeta smaragdinae]ADK80532.1 hypothetical protein Spirs_1405 [Sediminispirochaeta smaragdinae DSM 11293]
MKTKWLKSASLAVLFSLLIAGCAGTPEPEPVAPEPEMQQPAAEEKPLPEAEREEATRIREIIIETGTDKVEAEDFASSQADFDAAEAAYGSDNEQSKALFLKAKEGFLSILEKRYGSRLIEARDSAQAEKAKADKLFAPKAAAQAYNQGTSYQEEAQKQKSNYHYPAAIEAYEKAAEAFKESQAIAAEKRRKALEAIKNSEAAYQKTQDEVTQLESDVQTERSASEAEAEAEASTIGQEEASE